MSFLIAVSAMASGQSEWSLHTWQSDDGLPNNNVTGLAQTPDGYLWIANPSRLARFDGVHFANIPGRDIVVDTRQKFTTLLYSRAGGMWLGMDRGTIVYLDGKTNRILTNGLPDEYVNSLVEDADGSLWATFSGGTVCRIRNDVITHFNRTNGFTGGYACWLARDTSGSLWWAKGTQAGIFTENQFVPSFDFKQQPINGIAAASGGGVWLEVGNHLFHADKGHRLRDCGAFVSQPVPPQPAPLLEDSDHSVWIGTVDHGL
ncbi:MAG TPA: two-component regulator propeller domain-containing protein, partial [Desulfuromonadaceae bacterium]|nr:two-component regulator propeller domain-containing protein [Desulfuromonadaceae bacterium]